MSDWTDEERRSASLLLSALCLAPEQGLESFRNRRLKSSDIDLGHLRQARDILRALSDALSGRETTKWQRLEDAHKALQGEAPAVAAPASAAASAPAPLTPRPSPRRPLPSAPPSSSPGESPWLRHASQPAAQPPPSAGAAPPPNAPPAPKAPPPPKAPRARAPQAQAGSPQAAIGNTPPPSSSEDATGLVDIEALRREALPFQPGGEAAPRPAMSSAVDEGEQEEEQVGISDEQTAMTPIEASGTATPFEAKENEDPPLPDLSLEQYASLEAECAVHPAAAEEVQRRYGLDEESKRRLSKQWRRKFARDLELERRYRTHFKHYKRWFEERRS